jgi:hypothetical protein
MSYNLFLDDIRYPSDAILLIGDYEYKYSKEPIIIDPYPVKLLDVTKNTNADWKICRYYDAFVKTIEEFGMPNMISFDHDLHDEHMQHYFRNTAINDGEILYDTFKYKTGLACAQYIIDYLKDHPSCKKPTCYVHSANEWGRKNIRQLLDTMLYIK